MKLYLFGALPFFVFTLLLKKNQPEADPSPLAVFSAEWNDPKYLACNTAAASQYMSTVEKEVVYILNLLHSNPKLFANTVVVKYPDYKKRGHLKNIPEYKSLLDTLRKVRTLALLYPDSLCFESAKCHAITAGKEGYVGHDRKTDECKAKKRHNGECCQYGYNDALSIVMALLIDQGVSSLGHRFLCLSEYSRIGVAIRPHTGYGYNTVMDFNY